MSVFFNMCSNTHLYLILESPYNFSYFKLVILSFSPPFIKCLSHSPFLFVINVNKHNLHFLQFIKDFLEQYTIPSNIRLSKKIWKELFGEVVSRFPYAGVHFYLADFLRACSLKFKFYRSVDFITDLLNLDVQNFLSGEAGREREGEESCLDKVVHKKLPLRLLSANVSVIFMLFWLLISNSSIL